MDITFQDAQEAEKIDHWNFVNSVTNIHDDASKNYGTTGGESNFVTSKSPEDKDDGFESIKLRHQLEKSNHEIVELKAHIDRQKLQERNFEKEKNDIINERNELLKLLHHKNNVIERMLSDNTLLETQLKSTVSAKFDALIRLNATEGNGETLLFKEAFSETEALSRELDSTRQKLQKIKIHSEIMQQTRNDEPITYQSDVPNIMIEPKSPDAKKVKVNDTSELNSLFQGETAKTTENYENSHLVGSTGPSASDDNNMTVAENKNETPSGEMDINVVPSQNIQLDLLSEVRTRGQSQFIRDAFRSIEPTRNDTKADSKVDNKATHTPKKKSGRGRKRD